MKYLICSTFLLNSCLLIGQDKTNFLSDSDKELNIELNGKVKQVLIKNEDLRTNDTKNYIYNFDKIGSPLEIISYGLEVDFSLGDNAIEAGIRNLETKYIFNNKKLLSKLKNTGNGRNGEVYEYDENWNLIREKHYTSNILVKETQSKYDGKNRIIEKYDYLFGAFSKYNEKTQFRKKKYLHSRSYYRYDDKNNLISETIKNYKKDFTKEMIYKYDTFNNLIEEGRCFKSKGEEDCKYKPLIGFQYDTSNYLVKKFDIAEFKPHKTDTHYKYDNSGNEIEVIGYYIYPNQKPKIGYQYKYEYDEYGNMIRDIEVVGKYRSLYLNKYTPEVTNHKYTTEIMKYDEFQNIIEREFKDRSGKTLKVIINDYEYDNLGNWVRRETKEGKTYNDLETIKISTREIKYYE